MISVLAQRRIAPDEMKGAHLMSTEENKALARRVYEETMNQRNLATR